MMKSVMVGIGSGKVKKTHADMFNGLHQECFNPVLIHILDRLFMGGYYEAMSREQEQFTRRFVRLAGKITDSMKKGEQMPRLKLPHDFFQFDRFLGSYRGK